MSVVELQELDEVKGLIAKGQLVGVLSYAEIATATAALDVDEADVEELHGFLEKSEIELVEDIDPATAAASEVERASEERGRRKAKAVLDLKPDMTTDSLQLFLKDIGKVRLLTAREELDLAKRIERGDLGAKQKMVEWSATTRSPWSTPSRPTGTPGRRADGRARHLARPARREAHVVQRRDRRVPHHRSGGADPASELCLNAAKHG